jgi:hypothetical protein
VTRPALQQCRCNRTPPTQVRPPFDPSWDGVGTRRRSRSSVICPMQGHRAAPSKAPLATTHSKSISKLQLPIRQRQRCMIRLSKFLPIQLWCRANLMIVSRLRRYFPLIPLGRPAWAASPSRPSSLTASSVRLVYLRRGAVSSTHPNARLLA